MAAAPTRGTRVMIMAGLMLYTVPTGASQPKDLCHRSLASFGFWSMMAFLAILTIGFVFGQAVTILAEHADRHCHSITLRLLWLQPKQRQSEP